MTKSPLYLALFFLICLSIPLTAIAQTVDIPDPNLRAAIERSLDKASADVITAADMATLIDFDAPNINITDLTGLEHATNLIHLDLGTELVQVLGIVNSNSISDLSPLAGLYQLTSLDLDNNSISDISPLAGLTNLTRLYLSDNSITDISPLAGLYQLTTLWIHSNSITDLSPLGGLTNLTWLDLRSNSITDISPLAGLYQLTSLWLNSNSITGISPLAGLNRLIHLLLDNNSITDISPLAGLYQLTALRIHSNSITDISPLAGLNRLTYLLLDNNSITDISPLARLYQLTDLALDNNSISDISPLAGLNQLTGLDLRYNSISDISPLVENTGLGSEDYVKLTENPLNSVSINTHIPALQNRGVTVEVGNIAVQPEPPAQTVNIPDPNLRTAVENALRKASGATITGADMATLTRLSATESNISDLTGLEHATNLTRLLLDHNCISDISAVADLTNLTNLWLHHNSISDISAVADLTNLTNLFLNSNSISDISAVAGLTNLTWLLLNRNNISEISAVADLTNLTKLSLGSNNISDISAVAGLTNLKDLNLSDNNISEISAVADLANLTGLSLGINNITDISAVAGLTNLTHLWIALNSISDISPLVENTGLGQGDTVYMRENPLSYISTNTHILALYSRGVIVKFDDIVVQSADVNGDGVVNILDLVSVASHFGKQGQDLTADVNHDGIVDVRDLVLVAGMFGDAAAAPSAHPQAPATLTAAAVRGWLTDAHTLEVADPIMERGIVVLQQLLTSLTPAETELLTNYPNPFNPETWIPYRLAEDAFVTLTIYDQDGHVVRTLEVGRQVASAYENRSKAIYWDGRNHVGETVASGVYFYHLSAGDYSATRKMVILK